MDESKLNALLTQWAPLLEELGMPIVAPSFSLWHKAILSVVLLAIVTRCISDQRQGHASRFAATGLTALALTTAILVWRSDPIRGATAVGACLVLATFILPLLSTKSTRRALSFLSVAWLAASCVVVDFLMPMLPSIAPIHSVALGTDGYGSTDALWWGAIVPVAFAVLLRFQTFTPERLDVVLTLFLFFLASLVIWLSATASALPGVRIAEPVTTLAVIVCFVAVLPLLLQVAASHRARRRCIPSP